MHEKIPQKHYHYMRKLHNINNMAIIAYAGKESSTLQCLLTVKEDLS